MRLLAYLGKWAVTQGGALLLGGSGLLFAAGCVGAENPEESTLEDAAEVVVDPNPSVSSLKGVAVPEPSNLSDFIKSRTEAIALGKALFWDTQAGSDGQACASCHFHAGADFRAKNQLNPGEANTQGPPLSQTFNATKSGGTGGPNYQLTSADYPFHQLSNVSDRNSTVVFDTNDVTGSQGVFSASFQSIPMSGRNDVCTGTQDIFSVGGVNVRHVTGRNTPTVINAAFNFRNFWDGRANNVFNGVDPFGNRSPNAVIRVVQNGTAGGVQIAAVRIALKNASLASQAVGPLNNAVEMACAGRTFPDVGRKLISRQPLALQRVSQTDSVLGTRINSSGFGLATTYGQLIKNAFQDKYWNTTQTVNGRSLMETNFSLFWGLAIQVYESTLVSDDSPFDRFSDGDNTALTAQQQTGLAIFKDKGKCVRCHKGPEFTEAGTLQQGQDEEGGLIERMLMGDATVALYDSAFYNIGARPTSEDVGVGGLDPFGNPLSFTRQAKKAAAGGSLVDPFHVDPASFEVGTGNPVTSTEREAIDGAFKVPTLRNVSLTGPYFHNGGQATLSQVVAFYSRGGDRRGPNNNDTTGFGPNHTNLDADIEPLGLTPDEQGALVAFLESLTDARVTFEKAPFDHPELFVPNGHPGNTSSVTNSGNGQATDSLMQLPAVGAAGRGALGLPGLTNLF